MKPMLLTERATPPVGEKWIYEAKYDGFRCILKWEDETPVLLSRNGNVLNEAFPEIIMFCKKMYENVKRFLPLIFDGEIVYLENDWRSDFTTVQRRGRMRNEEAISRQMQLFPCHYVAFDLLMLAGKTYTDLALSERKNELASLFQTLDLPRRVRADERKRIQMIHPYKQHETVWKYIVTHQGEGIVAKRIDSKWEEKKRSEDWVKIKHWRYVDVILTAWNEANGYFLGAVYKEEKLIDIVVFKHGLTTEEEKTLRQFFKQHGKKNGDTWTITASICVTIACIGFDGQQLREPFFKAFRFDLDPVDSRWETMMRQLFPLPPTITITSETKLVWPNLAITKDRYLFYLQRIARFLLPFLKDRHLTVVRFAHGVDGERFFQKNCPDYAPDFVQTDENHILCNDLETLLWLGNQLALEFHIPFQKKDGKGPSEIVFDLDPPSVEDFSLAIEAALQMKAIFDSFDLISFVKTTGGKGLQLYLPLPDDAFTYEDTRLFTEFVCRYMSNTRPDLFTLERLKKKRGNRLYLDYLQHDKGKTVIAPFSPRGHEGGLVATPLYWDEVTHTLSPTDFTVLSVLDRLEKEGNPFQSFFEAKQKQPFALVIEALKQLADR